MKLNVINKLVSILCLLFCKFCFATEKDSIIVIGKIYTNHSIPKITFNSYKSETPLFEQKIDLNNGFRFSLPILIEPGVYYLEYNDGINNKIDVIINGIENRIVLELYQNNIKIIESKENKNWYDYLFFSQLHLIRLETLFKYLSTFQDEINNKKIVNEYQKERNRFYKNWKRFINLNKNSVSGILVKNKPYYFSNLRKKPVERDFLRRYYFWEGIDTGSTLLINTPIYKCHIDKYLSYVEDETMHRPYKEEEKINELKKSISIIIERFGYNNDLRQHAISCIKQNKLINKYKLLLNYINYNYDY